MEYILFILVIVLLVGGRSVKSIRAFRQELSDLENEPVRNEPAFESLFAMAKPDSRSFAEEERKAGYFTYETDDSSAEAQYKRPNVMNPVVQPAKLDESEAAPTFDLRLAIVHNAILTPKYLTEVGYIDN